MPPGVNGRPDERPVCCGRPPTTPPASPARRRPATLPLRAPPGPPVPMPCPIGARPACVPSPPTTVPRAMPSRPGTCAAGRPPTIPLSRGGRLIPPVPVLAPLAVGMGGRTLPTGLPPPVTGETTERLPPRPGGRAWAVDGRPGSLLPPLITGEGAEGFDGASGSAAAPAISIPTACGTEAFPR